MAPSIPHISHIYNISTQQREDNASLHTILIFISIHFGFEKRGPTNTNISKPNFQKELQSIATSTSNRSSTRSV